MRTVNAERSIHWVIPIVRGYSRSKALVTIRSSSVSLLWERWSKPDWHYHRHPLNLKFDTRLSFMTMPAPCGIVTLEDFQYYFNIPVRSQIGFTGSWGIIVLVHLMQIVTRAWRTNNRRAVSPWTHLSNRQKGAWKIYHWRASSTFFARFAITNYVTSLRERGIYRMESDVVFLLDQFREHMEFRLYRLSELQTQEETW